MNQPNYGLSPLTRGNPAVWRGAARAQGPIPAHAGEPFFVDGGHGRSRAYPRSRGGTIPKTPAIPVNTGLSPLTRGNPDDALGAQQG